MAMNILGLVMDVMTQLPSLIKDGSEAIQLIESTLGTVRAAQAQGRDPTQAEWDAIHSMIEGLTGRLDAPEVPSGAALTGEAGQRGDGTGTPTARPEGVVGTAANPDPAGVNPGPMFAEAHGAPGSTNVSLSTGGVMNTGGSAIALDTPDSLKVLDDHPRVAPSDEASQQNPVNPATGASGAPAATADAPPPASVNPAEASAPVPVSDAGASGAPAATADAPPPASDTVSTDGGSPSQWARYNADDAKARADLADFQAKAKRDFEIE